MAKKDIIQVTKADETARRLYLLYLNSIRNILNKTDGLILRKNKVFDISDFPKFKASIDEELKNLTSQSTNVINQATEAQWLKAYESNMLLAKPYMKRKLLTEAQQLAYTNRNLKALNVFQKRKIGGLGLSDKIWKYNNQFKGEIEMSIDVALKEGTSAQTLSRNVRNYLNNPDKLFRRYRNKNGVLQLSKAAKKYHPGEGVYRSSYKNAMRLVRTEVNMAYRASDHEKYKQFDFVNGFEVKRSNHFYGCDICEELKGIYPKTFKFVGWHPQCRCYTVPLLNSEADFIEQQKAILRGEEPKVGWQYRTPHKGFREWYAKNLTKIKSAKNVPYFIRDNQNLINNIKGAVKSTVVKVVEKLKAYIPKYNTIYEIKNNTIGKLEADSKFRPNTSKLWQKASEAEKDALYRYTTTAHTEIDASYYTTDGIKTETAKRLETAINKSWFEETVILKRGAGYRGFGETFRMDTIKLNKLFHKETTQASLNKQLIGKKGIMKGFSSCGASADTGFKKDFMLYIEAPPKTKMAYVEPYSRYGGGFGRRWDGIERQSIIGGEQEIILQANTKVEIVSVVRERHKLEIYCRIVTD